MDINTLRGIATILAMLAFIGITVWAYSSYKKKILTKRRNCPSPMSLKMKKLAVSSKMLGVTKHE